MAIILEIDYAKKLGLPGYSSHQCSVSMRSEVADVSDVPEQVEFIYKLLQESVDSQIVNPGFVPDQEPTGKSAEPTGWKCSDKQRDLILKIIGEHKLDRHDIEHLAHERFGHGVVLLNKLEASGLIDELLEQTKRNRPSRNYRRAA